MGYNLVQQENFSEKSKRYLHDISVLDNTYLIDSDIDVAKRTISMIYSGYGPSEEGLKTIKETALTYGIDTSKVDIVSGTDAEMLKQSTKRYISETQELEGKLNAVTSQLKNTQDSLFCVKNIPKLGESLLKEIQSLYPQIDACSYAETVTYQDTIQSARVPMVIFSSKQTLNRNDRRKISTWVQTRVNNENAKIYFE